MKPVSDIENLQKDVVDSQGTKETFGRQGSRTCGANGRQVEPNLYANAETASGFAAIRESYDQQSDSSKHRGRWWAAGK